MNEFFEQGELPKKEFRGFVRRVEPGRGVQVTIASWAWWKCFVHYRGKSIGCAKSKEKCPGCRLNWPRKLLSYLYIRNEWNGSYEHLELPFEAACLLEETIGGMDQLRGTRFRAKRIGGKTGKIEFELLDRLETVAPKFELADDRDPHEILEYLWGVNLGKLRLHGDDEIASRDAI